MCKCASAFQLCICQKLQRLYSKASCVVMDAAHSCVAQQKKYTGCLCHCFVFICNPIIVLATDASIIAPAASQLPAPAPSSSPAADDARCTAGHVRGVHRGVHMQICLAIPKPMKEQQLTFIVDSNVKYLNTHEHIAAAVQGLLGRFTCVAARCSTLQAQVWRIP